MRNKVWAAIGQTLLTAAVVTVFSLLALALFAVFVRAFAPSDGVITAVNWAVKCIGIFVSCLIFVKGERMLFKGMAAGVLSVLLTMLVFGIVGGAFRLTPFFLVELLVGLLLGALGAICGAKLRKD